MSRNPNTPRTDDLDIELLARIIRDVLVHYRQVRHIPSSDPTPFPESEPTDPDTLFTVNEAAERLNLSDRQVRYAIEHGHLEAVRLKGKKRGPIRVPASSIRSYLASCTISPRGPAPNATSRPKGKPFKHLKGPSGPNGGSSLGS